uniref:Endonuclease/exonuclease/phosphatase domain-containing protein n=1 Tax=Triticum urartu TaxID=4572 RepID=A0A8R7TME8_TRIUA
MSYNVWSREDVVVYKRMQAISRLVYQHSPDVIFFQEMTPYILKIFQSFSWWKEYHSSPISQEQQKEKNFCMMLSKFRLENYACWKFTTTATGKSYLEADINLCPGSTTMKPIRIATTQLECPCPPEPMHCMERYTQAEHAVTALSSAENVVFGGDMCWNDDTDLPFPLPDGWADASPSGRWTYDALWNEKVGEFGGAYRASHKSLQRRSDRFVCKLNDYKQGSIVTIGDQEVGVK